LADHAFGLPAMNAEQENLVKLAVEHYDRTGTKPTSTGLMLQLKMDVDQFQALLDSVPAVYLHKPPGSASDETMFPAMTGLMLVPGNEALIEGFLRLFRVASAVFLRNPQEDVVFSKDRVRTLLPKASDKDFLKFSFALLGGYYPGLMQKSGRADGEWSVSAGMPVLEFRAIRSLENYYQIINARKSRPANLDADLHRLQADVCDYWKRKGEWPDLLDFVRRYRNRANIVRLLAELPERLWHRINTDSLTAHLVGSTIRLKLEGVVAAGNCAKELETLVQMIHGFVAHFDATHGKVPISYLDLARNIGLDDELVRRVGLLIQHEAYTGIFIEDEPKWNAPVRKDVTRYKKLKDIHDFIARKNEQAKRELQRNYPTPITSATAAKRTIGRYALLQELGKGANGVVWRAEDADGSVQAIKLLEKLNQEEAKRLARELKLAATLRHEGLVTYLSTDLELMDDQHFIRMELVDGSSIKEFVGWKGQTCRPQSVSQFIHWYRGILPPLAHMHAARVVHRDLHAGNVMITRSGAIKIVDYGSARLIKEIDGTKTFSIPGTSTHTAEEVWEDPSSATPSSDYFSLGVIGYLLLTGQVPFWDQSVPKLYRRIQACHFTPPREVRADIPVWADALIRTMILKDANKRWQDAGAIDKLLELALTDTAAADQIAEQELERRLPKLAGPPNPWEQYGLPYKVEGGTPVLTGQELKAFSIDFPDQYMDSNPPRPARLSLDKMYIVAGRLVGKDAYFLEPAEPSEPLKDGVALSAAIQFRVRNHSQARHDYDLIIKVTNLGSRTVDDFLVEVEVPSMVLAASTLPNELPPRRTRTHRFFQFRKVDSDLSVRLHPGKMATVSLPYHFTDNVYDALNLEPAGVHTVRVWLYADEMAPRAVECPLSKLNNY
jgi:serine/threonine protein kinase